MGAYEPLAGDELEQMMARYARVRLDPSPAQARRARAAVMEEAWRRRIAAGDAAAAAAGSTPSARAARSAPHRGLFAGWSVRRLGVTFAAAVMAGLLVGSSVFAGSRAGGPLYGARLALEELALPSDAASYLEAEIARAQTRLAEIVDASARGDQTALAASIAAYEATVAKLERETGAGAQRALEDFRQHRAVLVAILANAPESAVSGDVSPATSCQPCFARCRSAAPSSRPATSPRHGSG